jgi:hypothetical protein
MLSGHARSPGEARKLLQHSTSAAAYIAANPFERKRRLMRRLVGIVRRIESHTTADLIRQSAPGSDPVAMNIRLSDSYRHSAARHRP